MAVREQELYARWLDVGARAGLAALAAAFALYLSGALDAHVPPADLPALWILPLEEFRARTGAPAGWGWLALLGTGDYLSLAAVALLALATLVCYVRLAVHYLSANQRTHAALALAQVIVLLVAASGLIGGGH